MDCKTGDILKDVTQEDFDKHQQELGRQLIELSEDEVQELELLTKDQRKGRMRNKECPCGSNKKFKKCCWSKYT